jgi:transposase
VSIPGTAQATALSLLVEMPELGGLNQSQVASLAGLARVARQRGFTQAPHDTGRPRAHVRQVLYMQARVAARFNLDLEHRTVKRTHIRRP